DDLVRVFAFQSILRKQFIGVEGRASFDTLLDFILKDFLASILYYYSLNFPPRSTNPATAVLSFPPVPVMRRLRCAMCMFRALPPMNVSSTSTSPLSFMNVPDCMA